MRLRRAVFWIHLAAGVMSGAVVAIMSLTGVAIAFEEEILAWCDRDAGRIGPLAADVRPLAFEEARAQAAQTGFVATQIGVSRDPARAWDLYAGREGPLYVHPATGELRPSRAHEVHEAIHFLEEWHRWLGMPEERLAVGRAITGACNLAFLVLCVTGLYLWFPRQWTRPALRPRVWFTGARGKARDFNWHHVLGFWSLPVLAVLAATAVVISYEWGHRLVFFVAGETAPKARNFAMMATPAAVVPPPPAGATRLPLETALARVQEAFPAWQKIDLYFPPAAAPGTVVAPLNFDVTLPDYMPSRAYVPVEVDPFTGNILQAVRFQERSAGLQARVWIRFLHTGAGFGLPGKIVATVATLASLVLVYTGLALSWRRLRRTLRAEG